MEKKKIGFSKYNVILNKTNFEIEAGEILFVSPFLKKKKKKVMDPPLRTSLVSFFDTKTSIHPPRDFRVLLVGDSGVGKSSIINELNSPQVAPLNPDKFTLVSSKATTTTTSYVEIELEFGNGTKGIFIDSPPFDPEKIQGEINGQYREGGSDLSKVSIPDKCVDLAVVVVNASHPLSEHGDLTRFLRDKPVPTVVIATHFDSVVPVEVGNKIEDAETLLSNDKWLDFSSRFRDRLSLPEETPIHPMICQQLIPDKLRLELNLSVLQELKRIIESLPGPIKSLGVLLPWPDQPCGLKVRTKPTSPAPPIRTALFRFVDRDQTRTPFAALLQITVRLGLFDENVIVSRIFKKFKTKLKKRGIKVGQLLQTCKFRFAKRKHLFAQNNTNNLRTYVKETDEDYYLRTGKDARPRRDWEVELCISVPPVSFQIRIMNPYMAEDVLLADPRPSTNWSINRLVREVSEIWSIHLDGLSHLKLFPMKNGALRESDSGDSIEISLQSRYSLLNYVCDYLLSQIGHLRTILLYCDFVVINSCYVKITQQLQRTIDVRFIPFYYDVPGLFELILKELLGDPEAERPQRNGDRCAKIEPVHMRLSWGDGEDRVFLCLGRGPPDDLRGRVCVFSVADLVNHIISATVGEFDTPVLFLGYPDKRATIAKTLNRIILDLSLTIPLFYKSVKTLEMLLDEMGLHKLTLRQTKDKASEVRERNGRVKVADRMLGNYQSQISGLSKGTAVLRTKKNNLHKSLDRRRLKETNGFLSAHEQTVSRSKSENDKLTKLSQTLRRRRKVLQNQVLFKVRRHKLNMERGETRMFEQEIRKANLTQAILIKEREREID